MVTIRLYPFRADTDGAGLILLFTSLILSPQSLTVFPIFIIIGINTHVSQEKVAKI